LGTRQPASWCRQDICLPDSGDLNTPVAVVARRPASCATPHARGQGQEHLCGPCHGCNGSGSGSSQPLQTRAAPAHPPNRQQSRYETPAEQQSTLVAEHATGEAAVKRSALAYSEERLNAGSSAPWRSPAWSPPALSCTEPEHQGSHINELHACTAPACAHTACHTMRYALPLFGDSHCIGRRDAAPCTPCRAGSPPLAPSQTRRLQQRIPILVFIHPPSRVTAPDTCLRASACRSLNTRKRPAH